MEKHVKTYIAVSVPDKEYRAQAVAANFEGFGTVTEFALPALRVGTLDSLLSLSDELTRLDHTVTSIMAKVARASLDLRQGESLPNVEVRAGTAGLPPDDYVRQFRWSDNFQTRLRTNQLVENMVKTMTEIDERMRAELAEASNIKNELANILRKEQGSLQSRSLSSLVKPEHVVSSEYLKSFFVFVPTHMVKQWNESYETLAMQDGRAWVVPRSSMLIKTEQEGSLFRVVVFRMMADQFKSCAREAKYTVREFEFSAEESAAADDRRVYLEEQAERLTRELQANSTGYFSEAFTNWVHFKVLRLHVESVLRYGLPPNFKAFFVRVDKKNERKAKQGLVKMFGHLGGVGFQENDLDSSSTEFLPVVCNVLSLV